MSIGKKRVIFIVGIMFFLIGTLSLILTLYNNSNESIKLDKVSLKTNNTINNNMFAIMIQKEDGSGYEQTNAFPTDFSFNEELSGCIDVDGKAVAGALTFNQSTNSVLVATNGSIYCYLYFDKDSTPPTVTASAVDNNTKTPKISITSNEDGTYCVNTSSTSTDFSSCTFTGSVTANTALTTSDFTTSGTYYVHVKDAAGNIGVSSAVSIQCGNPFGNYLINAKPLGFNSTMEGGLYRFQGTNGNVNNFICFGTSDKNTCLGNTDVHIYRIIGITENGSAKLIKNEALNSTVKWYSSSSSNITWPNSTLYSAINGSSFLTNSTYMPSGWNDKIETTTWKYGDNTNVKTTADALYNIENAWANTTNAKIGLMYAHDYAYAYQNGGLNCSSSGQYSTCKKSWMYISNCDSGAPSTYEWTMSRYGFSGSTCLSWRVDSSGYFDSAGFTFTYSVRPVFFLTSNVNYVSGTGTSTDPFIIS